ncbi:MAG: aminotransferase class I/II-fold pyridoxal phosphate-dependent enzyme [bacterium]
MKIDIFELERTQSLWENTVDYNLTETGLHPFTIEELLSGEEIEQLLAIRMGYGQTNGTVALREAISRMYPATDCDNVLVTSGSAEANFVAMWTLLEPGDELVLMLPNYMQLWGVARAFGMKVSPFTLKEELNWQPDLAELEAIVTPATKVIAVCNPNNPTGSVLSESAMAAIIRLAAKTGAWVYADEIYRGAELNGRETPTFLGRYEKVMVCGGLSKAYALPGLRIGWLVGPQQQIAEGWARRDYTSIATAILSNHIATLALQPKVRAKILQRNRKILSENLKILSDWVGKHRTLFHFIPPQAGGMAFLKYDLNLDSTELSTRLRMEKSTLIVAGDCFGMDHRVRIGIGAQRDYLLAGLARFDEFLSGIRAPEGRSD